MRRVLVAPAAREQHIVSVSHPRTGTDTLFLLARREVEAGSSNSFHMCELNHARQDQKTPRSWFIDQDVLQDGSMLVATPVDPLLLLLPALRAASSSGHFRSVADLVAESRLTSAPEARGMLSSLGVDVLAKVAETKTSGSDVFVRYSEEKTLAFLTARLQKVIGFVSTNAVSTGDASAAHFRAEGFNKITPAVQHTSVELLCEYLEEDLADAFRKACGIHTSSNTNSSSMAKGKGKGKGKGADDGLAVAARRRGAGEIAGGGATQKSPKRPQKQQPKFGMDYTNTAYGSATGEDKYQPEKDEEEKKKKKPQKSLAMRKMEQTNTKGMKSISSFFKPKAK